jgi:branched-chain amino acid transport system permease protein
MEYLINLGILFCIYGVLALSLNMTIGMSGLLSLAQASFYGIGAYVTAITMTSLGFNFFASLGLGIVINVLVAIFVGQILSKFKSGYYAIVSAGLAIIAYSLFLNAKGLTNGPLGIFGIPKPTLFGYAIESNSAFLMLAFIIILINLRLDAD